MPPAAPSFPPCRKRWGRKGALDYVWCILRVQFMQAPALSSLQAHLLTLRALWYAPPVTVHRICKQLRFNICGENALRLKFARQYRFAAVPSKPPLAASRAVRGGFWLIAGLVPARPRLPGEPSISGSTGKRRKHAQRIRGSAHSGDSFRRGRFRRASGGHIFSLAREKIWKKRVRGDAGCVLLLNLGEVLVFRYRSTRDLPYGRLSTCRLIRGYLVCS